MDFDEQIIFPNVFIRIFPKLLHSHYFSIAGLEIACPCSHSLDLKIKKKKVFSTYRKIVPLHGGFDPKLYETTGILPLTSVVRGLGPYAFTEE